MPCLNLVTWLYIPWDPKADVDELGHWRSTRELGPREYKRTFVLRTSSALPSLRRLVRSKVDQVSAD